MSAAVSGDGRSRNWAPYLLSGPALLLFIGVVVAPIAMTALLSFQSWDRVKGIGDVLVLAHWREVLSDGYFAEMFLRTLRLSVIVTVLTAVIGAPEAYILHRMTSRWKGVCLLVILGPLLISVVARTLGWALLFGGANGVVNQALIKLGIISAPLPFMFTETGVAIALAHVLMPFMVLAVSASLQKVDPKIEHAAASLGARPATVVFRIVLPQVMPGLLSGAIIGGRRLKVASTLIYDEFLNSLNWPLGAVIAMILLLALVAIVAGSNRIVERRYAEAFS